MKYLLDTHLLLWTVIRPAKLPAFTIELIEDRQNEVFFSVVSIWETAIKNGRGYNDFQVEPSRFRQTLLESDYAELPVFGEHAVAVGGLPRIHKDPFDRILIAQAMVEGITLLTSDVVVAKYPGPIRLV